MPALAPSSAIAVSQLPRWPIASLRTSSARAGGAVANNAAARMKPKRVFMAFLRVGFECSAQDGQSEACLRGRVRVSQHEMLVGWVERSETHRWSVGGAARDG